MYLPRPFGRMRRNRRGASIAEYGLLVGLVAVLSIVAVEQSGSRISNLTATVAAELGAVSNEVGAPAETQAPASPELDVSTCPNIGDTCNDGSIYAGNTSTDASYSGGLDREIYVAAIDKQTWSQSDTFEWGRQGVAVPGADSGKDGYQNTLDLLAHGGHPAAEACGNLEAHGHADWYLPDDRGLEVLANAYQGGQITTFDNADYWGSTEKSDSNARAHPIAGGLGGPNPKGNQKRVRCVRTPGL